jgi:short-subunit dehydrogenase involved in D-alanine esterification of teichoic acids
VQIDINIRGLFMMCAAWLPHLKSKPKACIVNVSSGLAFVPLTRCPAYCATKARHPQGQRVSGSLLSHLTSMLYASATAT